MELINKVKALFTENGIELINKPQRKFWETKLNGFKVEVTPKKIKGKEYVFIRYGYGEKPDRLNDLINLMDADAWFRKGNDKTWAMIDSIPFNGADDVFLAFVELQDALDGEHGLGRRSVTPVVAKATLKPTIVEIATIFHTVVNSGVSFGDLFSRWGMDNRDDDITVGESYLHAKVGDTYREHAVPCILLQHRMIEMCRDGATIDDLVAFLNRNLKIVLITKDEAKMLDSVLKTDMPHGWVDGDDPLARFAEAHIEVFTTSEI
jgi:hypothetical protein